MQNPRRRFLTWLLVVVSVVGLAFYARRGWATYQEWRLDRMSTTDLEGLARSHPADVSATYHLGLAYSREGKLADATRELISALQRDPGRADILNDLGVTYLLQERHYEALVAFQGAITADPNFAPAHANLGRLYLSTEMPYSAVRELEAATRLAPRNSIGWCDLGEGYQAIVRFADAERAYRRALAVDSRCLPAYVGLGRTYSATTRLPEAKRELEKAISISPEYGPALAVLGKVTLQSATSPAETQKAHDLLAHATTVTPQDAEAWIELGRAYVQLNQPTRGVEALQRALRLSPHDAGAMHQMERALRASGRISEADRMGADYQRVALLAREQTRLEEKTNRSSNPSWDDRARLAELYLQTGKDRLALLIIRQLEHGVPHHPKLPMLVRMLSQTAGAPNSSGISPSGKPSAEAPRPAPGGAQP